jgi:ferritin-like metal-binding protein YciE
VLLLGEILYVERRLAGEVLQHLIDACSDTALAEALNEHLAETRLHVERVETAFRRIEVAPTANLSPSFESAVSQHDKLARSIVAPGLADVFHAATALRTEHWEIASYTALLELGQAPGYGEELSDLRTNLNDEEHARDTLVGLIAQLTAPRRL